MRGTDHASSWLVLRCSYRPMPHTHWLRKGNEMFGIRNTLLLLGCRGHINAAKINGIFSTRKHFNASRRVFSFYERRNYKKTIAKYCYFYLRSVFHYSMFFYNEGKLKQLLFQRAVSMWAACKDLESIGFMEQWEIFRARALRALIHRYGVW